MSLLVVNPIVAPAPAPVAKAQRVFSVTVQPRPGETIPDLCRRFTAQLQDRAATPLQVLAFGDCRASAAVTDALRNSFGRVDWPITWVEGAACGSEPIAGIQAHAFTGAVERVEFDGRVVGSVFMDGGARQCLIGGIMPGDKTLARPEQTRHTLEALQSILAAGGFDLADAVRTWFFLDNILSWYDDFNRARTAIYSGVKFRTGSLPASTGVGARNPSGGALALAVWALRPLGKNSYAEEVASPLQCPAPAYGSSFSRAMEISTNGGRRLFISGTASIAPGGKTLWTGDVRKQMALAMEVVDAILRSRGFGFADLARGTVYFRHLADAGVFTEWLAANRLPDLPVIAAQCDVCRDDLLFEIEAEAEAQTANP
jgi:enamine deaminase RidA (YjgF/YER057c/UK114 family)